MFGSCLQGINYCFDVTRMTGVLCIIRSARGLFVLVYADLEDTLESPRCLYVSVSWTTRCSYLTLTASSTHHSSAQPSSPTTRMSGRNGCIALWRTCLPCEWMIFGAKYFERVNFSWEIPTNWVVFEWFLMISSGGGGWLTNLEAKCWCVGFWAQNI